MIGGAHIVGTTAIDQGHILGAEALRLDRDVDGGIAAADDDHLAPDRERRFVLRLAELRDIGDGILDTRHILARNAQGIHPGKAHGKEDRIEIAPQIGEGNIAPQGHAAADLDAAQGENESHLGLGEVMHGLVGGDAVFVKAADFLPRLEHHNIVTKTRQAVRCGKAGGAAAHDGNFLPAQGCPHERLQAASHQRVGRITLQRADLHRLRLGMLAHAGILAQDLDRADAGAHAAHDIGFEDRLGGADGIAGGDGADKARNVDGGRAGIDAGRIEAIEAAAAFNQRPLGIERRLHIVEIGRQLLGGEAAGTDVWRRVLAHRRVLPSVQTLPWPDRHCRPCRMTGRAFL